MLLDPKLLTNDLDRLEEIEKVSLRLVVQSIYDYREIQPSKFSNKKVIWWPISAKTLPVKL